MKAALFAPHHLAHDKAAIRQDLRRARICLPQAERTAAERAAQSSLKKLIKRNRRIAVYWPVGSEMRLNNFIQAAQKRGAELYLPYIEAGKRRLWFTPYRENPAKCRRPTPIPQFDGRKIRADRLHLLLLPFIGIDRRGIRLGQGGGYYDSTLAACRSKRRPKTAAVGFACQSVAQLPGEAHDEAAGCFVCERGIFRLPLPAEQPSKQT